MEEDGSRLLAAASRASDLRVEGAVPFRLKATFSFLDAEGRRVPGDYELAWAAKEKWREEIRYASHQHVWGQDGAREWLRTDLPYQPLRILDIESALDFASRLTLGSPSRVESIKEVKLKKRPMTLVRVNRSGRFPWLELWVDRENGLLVREEARPREIGNAHFSVSYEYSDFIAFGERRFPGLIRRYDRTVRVLEIRVQEITALPSDVGPMFSRPEGAIDYPRCTEKESAARTTCEAGSWRDVTAMAGNPKSYMIAVRSVLGRDGRLHDITVVDPGDFMSDGIYLRYVETWRCKPFVCGGIPVDGETYHRIMLRDTLPEVVE
jgi:hypothetical protein